MNFYELEDSLQPRVFVLSCNENALVIQTTVDESKIVLNNRVLSNYYSITASSNLLFQYGSNTITQFSYSNDRAIQQSDLHYLNQLEIQPTSNLARFSSNAQFYYTDNILKLQFPSITHTFNVDGNILSTGTIYASNLQITGDSVILNTVTSNTEQMIITNLGSGPALKVTQEGVNPVAEFYDDTTLALLIADGGTIGIHTSYPLQTLDVRGSQIVSGNLGIGTTDPLYPLHIIGNSFIDGTLNIGGTIIASNLSGTATQVSQDLIRGTYLTGDNYNGSIITTWAVDADTANTPNKVVVRDASGNFSAGTITATLSGTATQVQNDLVIGSYLTGNNYNGVATTTWAVDATTTATPSKIVARDTTGQIFAANIGVGTTAVTLGTQLDVLGTIKTTDINAFGGVTANVLLGAPTVFVNRISPHSGSNIGILYGNLGIGKTDPVYPLDVVGDAYINGSITTNNNNINAGSGTITAATFLGTATQVGQDLIRGTYLTGNNYNGLVATTWGVDADSANTANKVVARDASGNFSAGTITATLSGTATQVSENLTRGTYLTGNNYNGSVATTWAVDADSANTANKVVVRDASGNFSAGTITATLSGTATKVGQDLIRGTYLTGANYNGAGTTTWAVDATTTATADKVVARDASGNIYATNVGIGTTVVRTNLDVIGNTLISGNVGIGTSPESAIQSKFYIYNSGKTQDSFRINHPNSGDITGITKPFLIDKFGNVGVGNTMPVAALDVYGATPGGGKIAAIIRAGSDTDKALQIKGTNSLHTGNLLEVYRISSSTTPDLIIDGTGANLGIGTTVARQKLDIQGGNAIVSGNIGIGTTVPLQGLDVRGTIIATSIGIGTIAPRAEVDIIGTTLHTGNIGIGTTVAKYPIHVHSAENVFTVNNGKLGISYGTAISPSTDLEIRNSLDTNYTGILLTNDGNNYPTASLRIESKRYDQSPNIAYAGNMGLYRYNNNASLTSNLPLGLIHFGGNHTSGSTANKAFSAYLGAISEEDFVSASAMRTAIVFAPGSNAYDYYNTTLAHTNEKMRLNSYGNLGIGTTSPTTTLDVRGNIIMGKGVNGIYNSFVGGPYHKQAGWDTAGTSHTIAYPSYCVADNSSGTLHIQVKSATADKLGNASVSFLKANATAVDLFNIHYHKTTNLTTFTISASTNDITITTDSDCAIAWTSIGSC